MSGWRSGSGTPGQLPATSNPYDVLYGDVLSVDDLRRIFDHL